MTTILLALALTVGAEAEIAADKANNEAIDAPDTVKLYLGSLIAQREKIAEIFAKSQKSEIKKTGRAVKAGADFVPVLFVEGQMQPIGMFMDARNGELRTPPIHVVPILDDLVMIEVNGGTIRAKVPPSWSKLAKYDDEYWNILFDGKVIWEAGIWTNEDSGKKVVEIKMYDPTPFIEWRKAHPLDLPEPTAAELALERKELAAERKAERKALEAEKRAKVASKRKRR
jgi:hypothetical protein